MAINVSVQYNGGLLPDNVISIGEPVYMPLRGFVFAAFDPNIELNVLTFPPPGLGDAQKV